MQARDRRPPAADRQLQTELRALEQRAVAARKAAGSQASASRREAAKLAGGQLSSQRISDWLAPDPARARVPRDADRVWALVEVWAAWAGETPDRRHWNNLVEAAQEVTQDAARSAPGPAPEDRFAAVVAGDVAQELERLEIHRPYPLPVGWEAGAGEGTSDVLDAYRSAPHGRLVVLGPAGAGKTVFALRLALALLERREPGDPVPVVFQVRGWTRPHERRAWMAAALVERYGENVDRGRILPVFDGLDELPPDLRAAAVKALPADALVLTSTEPAYRDAVARAGPVPDATEIRLVALPPAEVERYLGRPVETLRTPLAVALARDVLRAGQEPRGERQLVEAFVPAVYHVPLRGHQLEHRRSPRPWHADDPVDRAVVTRYVTTLARVADRDDGRLAWWRLHRALPRGVRMGAQAVVFMLAAAAGSLLAHLVSRFSDVPDLLPAAPSLVAVAAVVGAVRAGRERLVPLPVRTRWRFRGRTLRVAGAFVVTFLLAKAFLLPAKLAAVAAGERGQLAAIVVLSWGIGLAVATTFALRQFVETPVDLRAAPDATGSVLAGRRSLLTTSVIVLGSTAAGLVGMFAVTADALALGLMFAAFAAPMRLAAAAMGAAYGRFALVVRPVLALTGRLPWRLLDFLDDAHCRGVLRQVGPVYLFRHESLRRALLKDG